MKKLKNKRTKIIIIFTLIILILAIVFITYNKNILGKLSGLVVRHFEDNNATSIGNNTKNSNEIFIIEPITNEDILNDRIKIKNTGNESIGEISVYVNGKTKGIVQQKIINPGKSEYLYLTDVYPAGEANLQILYKEYSQEISFDVAEDWHVVLK